MDGEIVADANEVGKDGGVLQCNSRVISYKFLDAFFGLKWLMSHVLEIELYLHKSW